MKIKAGTFEHDIKSFENRLYVHDENEAEILEYIIISLGDTSFEVSEIGEQINAEFNNIVTLIKDQVEYPYNGYKLSSVRKYFDNSVKDDNIYIEFQKIK